MILKPHFLVAEDLSSGALVALLPGWRAPELGIHAVYPTRRHLAPKVRLLVDFLAQALDEAGSDQLGVDVGSGSAGSAGEGPAR